MIEPAGSCRVDRSGWSSVDTRFRAAYFATVRTLVSVAALLCLLASGAAYAGATTHIQPGDHFIGLVNGSSKLPVVYTICPGPATLGRTGPVQGGQTLAVTQVAAGHGYTGPFSQVYAWIATNAPVNGPLQVTLRTYGTQKAIPTAVRVPCDGAGRVEFSSCPYLAPCAAGWVPTFVRVRFVNIAA